MFEVRLTIKTKPNPTFSVDVNENGTNHTRGSCTKFKMTEVEAKAIQQMMGEVLNALGIPKTDIPHGDGITYKYDSITDAQQLLIEAAVNSVDSRVIMFNQARI